MRDDAMYCDFYQLRERPFNVTADPKFLYLNTRYREALASLEYGISQRKGFVTLIGEAGTGKTTLLKKLLDDLDPSTRTVFIFNTNVTFDEILEYIFGEFDLPIHNGKRLYMLQRLNAFLLEQLQQGRNVALLIDEAQDLDSSALEDLRLLSNLETAKEKILQIVLSGQPELGQKLGSPALRQLRQRVAINCRLLPLAREEMSEYIEARITAAGGADPQLFTRDAQDRIFEISMGIPRLVNIVCDNALVIGYALGKRRIGAEVVTEAAADLLTMESPEEPGGGGEAVAEAVDGPFPRSRRWSQVGVVAVVLIAIAVGLLSVGRSLLRTQVSLPLVTRPPLEVIPPGVASGTLEAARDLRQRQFVQPAASGRSEPERLERESAVDREVGLPDSVGPAPAETTGKASRPVTERPRGSEIGPEAAANPRLQQEAAPANPRLQQDEDEALAPQGARLVLASPANLDDGRGSRLPAAPPRAAAVREARGGEGAAGGRYEPVNPPAGAATADARATAESGDKAELAPQRYEQIVVGPQGSISQIAVRKYGQASHTILDLMKIANPAIRNVDVVSVGQRLRLPELDEGLVLLRQQDGRLTLLLLSSPNRSRLKRMEAALRRNQFNAQVRETEFGAGRRVYRLLVAGLPSRDAALTAGRQIQRLFREDERPAALAR